MEDKPKLAAQNSATKYFYLSSYEKREKQYPLYFMNQSGFSLLVMVFTGEKAGQFKEHSLRHSIKLIN